MASNIDYSICYLIEGESTPDLLEISSTASVHALKKRIQGEIITAFFKGSTPDILLSGRWRCHISSSM
jgi:hypothetical protein